ncbi:MAG: nucleotidyltransferase domain-containing protein [Chloroflexota bacterium]
MTPETHTKRDQLQTFIEREMSPHSAVKGVVGIGSIATGNAHANSDIDAVVFLEPFDPYIVPAECIWRPSDASYHSILSEVEGWQLDFARFDLTQWSHPDFNWPEGRCAELSSGWLAFDRDGQVTQLIATRTAYPDDLRVTRLDEAITWLDQHLSDDAPEHVWEQFGPIIAHDRLSAAYHYLAQALFAYNWRWRVWRNREIEALLSLPWLPDAFAESILLVLTAPSLDHDGYMARVETLSMFFADLLEQVVADGIYTEDPISEAFIRRSAEPGRAWNMDEWNEQHREIGVKG